MTNDTPTHDDQPPWMDSGPDPAATEPARERPTLKPPAERGDPPRVSVVSETEPARAAEPRHDDDEFQYHSAVERPSDMDAAIEFIDVHKAFGRNRRSSAASTWPSPTAGSR